MQWQSIRGQYAAMETGAGNPGDPGRVFSPGAAGNGRPAFHTQKTVTWLRPFK